AIDQIDVTFLIHSRKVAGVKPPVPQSVLGVLGPLPVTQHDVRTSGDNFSDLAWNYIRAVFLYDAHFDPVDRLPARRQSPFTLVRTEMIRVWKHSQKRRCFCQTVALTKLTLQNF